MIKFNLNDYKQRKNLQKESERTFMKLASKILGKRLKEIKKVNIRILKEYPSAKGCDIAFNNLYKNGTINLILTPSYDVNKKYRTNALAHELVHIKDIIDKKLEFIYNSNEKYYLWENKKYTKVYSYDIFDSFSTRKEQVDYISKICPWEKEACLVADSYL